MNKAHSDEYDYINFLIAAQKSYSCLEAGKVQPDGAGSPSHDSLTRLLHREVPSTSKLWKEAKSQVKRTTGLLILNMTEIGRLSVSEKVWTIENYLRGLKQFCGVEKCQCRSATAQRNHIGCSIRAFLRLEVYSFASGHSWFEAKTQIIRHAIRAYLQNPLYILHSTA